MTDDYLSPFGEHKNYVDVFEQMRDGSIVAHWRKIGEQQAVCTHWSARYDIAYPVGEVVVCPICQAIAGQIAVKSRKVKK